MLSISLEIAEAKIINETLLKCFVKPIHSNIEITENYFSTFDVALFDKNLSKDLLSEFLKNYEFWAESGTLFYYFFPPKIKKITPHSGNIDESITIYLESEEEWDFQNGN